MSYDTSVCGYTLHQMLHLMAHLILHHEMVEFSTVSLSTVSSILPATAVQCWEEPAGDHPDRILMGPSNSQRP